MFRVPDPEEIFEAYREGFIDYDDYRELLEIARAEFLSVADSLFILQFPDLLAGLSTHPVLDGEDTPVDVEEAALESPRPHWRQALLFRQYHQLDGESRCRRLYRLQDEYAGAAFYGEFEEDYTHRRTWYRRSIEYRIRTDSSRVYSAILGNFRTQFALGLIYGYRGQLLSNPGDPTRTESLLYPDYGGGNGFMVAADRPEGQYLLVLDVDRNPSFKKEYAGLSVPVRAGPIMFRVSGGWGRIANIIEGSAVSVSLVSLAILYEKNNVDVAAEAAADINDRKRPAAAAGRLSWRKGRVFFRGEGWFYGDVFPSYFTGALSSHRSRTIYVDEIDFSYGDRYRAERGVAVGSTVPMSSRTTMRTALMYAGRGFDDDRIEARLGMKRRLNRYFRIGIDLYLRSDHLYSNDETQRRIQLEMIHSGKGIRNRIVLGRRMYTYGDHDDYLLVFESGLRGPWGGVSVSCKFDRLQPESWANEYTYMTAQYEVDIGGGIASYVKYSYRYDRGNSVGSYGIFRWDVRWVIQ